MKLPRMTAACIAAALLATIAFATTQFSRQALAQTVSAAVTGFLNSSGSTVADSVANPHPVALGGTPYANAQAGANSMLTFSIPGVAGKYFYLTSFQVEGNGASTSGNVLITYTNMAGGVGSPSISYGTLTVAGNPAAQVEYTKTFTYPWQSAAQGASVQITVAAFGVGNVAVAGRVIGYYQ